MKTSGWVIGLVAAMAAAAGAQERRPGEKPVPWGGYNRGVHWEATLEAALKKAGETGKPVLLHQLVGDMKAEGC